MECELYAKFARRRKAMKFARQNVEAMKFARTTSEAMKFATRREAIHEGKHRVL